MGNNAVFVLLAGGKSERMGIAKGLLEYQNTYWILEQINRISASTVTEVYIGLGFHYEEYLNKIPWFTKAQSLFINYKNLKVRVVVNQNPELGSFSTLQTVLQQIPKNKSVLINPIDIPILNANELQNIIEEQNLIVLPNFKGKNGHPIKLHSEFWEPLLLLNPTNENSRLDLEIKKIIPSKITTITVTDSCILKNLNTPNDWIEFTNSNHKRA
ncbi:NTP transferase domain-containing protein [Flavobacterium granuli]|uniref:CTP:molybdopterin cytidylyltransferase MocA n=1 Tax=Flavobacterium granuli TaxID=280093 RepID=A0ABU1S649_9FLAO|nr:NTP transferase domain-containing protein [Flavobacterium granuli]MDR6846511.1 CTP:molybdopterin cytidylyltransferase MocA [Flavobacterium granuli]